MSSNYTKNRRRVELIVLEKAGALFSMYSSKKLLEGFRAVSGPTPVRAGVV